MRNHLVRLNVYTQKTESPMQKHNHLVRQKIRC